MVWSTFFSTVLICKPLVAVVSCHFRNTDPSRLKLSEKDCLAEPATSELVCLLKPVSAKDFNAASLVLQLEYRVSRQKVS